MPGRRVVLDACVLYDAAVRDLLLRLSFAGLIEPAWSVPILDECFAALARSRPDITAPQRDRLRDALNQAFPSATVIPALVNVALPDPDDVHVAGAAIAAGTSAIVTYNLSDFPRSALQPLGIVAEHPDAIALAVAGDDPKAVRSTLIQHAAALRRPPTTIARLLDTLDARGMHKFVAAVRNDLADSNS